MRTFSYVINEIVWWWERKHNPLAKLPSWQAAREAERRAMRRGCTQDIGHSRRRKADALHENMRAGLRQIARENPEQARRIRESF